MAQSVTAPAPAHSAAVRTRLVRFEDFGAIAALQQRNGLTTRSYSAWVSLWNDNPALALYDSRFPLGWVLEDSAGVIRGYLGNVPLAYAWRGETIRAATPFSWVVDSAYRFHSLDLQRRFVCQTEVDLFVYTTLNAVTEKLLRAFSFSRLETGTWDSAGFWITHPLGFARSVTRVKKWPSALAYPMAASLSMANLFRNPRGSSVPFELCADFDARFDTFWRDLSEENRESLVAVRDRQTLAWHFRRAIQARSLWILAASQGGRLVAYAVFDRHDNPDLQLKRVRIADFQALRGFEHLLRPALHWVIERCRREKIHIVENSGRWLERYSAARTRAPYCRPLQAWLFYYRTNNQQFQRELERPGAWAASAYDGDATI